MNGTKQMKKGDPISCPDLNEETRVGKKKKKGNNSPTFEKKPQKTCKNLGK